MRWCAPGFEHALEHLTQALASASWPEPPPGWQALGEPRPMRAVLRGTVAGPAGPVAAVAKWHRPVTRTDEVARRLRGGKGPREGRILRHLEAHGVAAPRALAFGDEGADLLLMRDLGDLASVRSLDATDRSTLRAGAGLVAQAHAAGLVHRDLHIENVAVTSDGPVLVDLGGARLRDGLSDRERLRELARLRHGLFRDVRRPQRLRALCYYFEQVGDAAGARERARAWANPIERKARAVARRYRRGRDRRPARSGRHYLHFETEGGARGVRARSGPALTTQEIDAWLEGDLAAERDLKEGGRVVLIRHPGEPSGLVVKRYGPVAAGRRPRPLRAFQTAAALSNRHVPVPPPLLAAWRPDGSGILVTCALPAPNVHAFSGGGRGGTWATLPPERRERVLTCLGRTLRAMHDEEVRHRDLKAPNLLIRNEADAPAAPIVIADVDGARVANRPVSWARRAKDLARLDASLDATRRDRLRVLRAYYDVLPRPPVSLGAFAARIARHVRRKRGPSGRPR